MLKVLTLLSVVGAMSNAQVALAATTTVSTTWCAATVSGVPGRQKTYYSQLFTTPVGGTSLDQAYKRFVTSTYASQPGAIVDTQCQQQSVEKVAASMRKSDEASDARLSNVVEIVWPR